MRGSKIAVLAVALAVTGGFASPATASPPPGNGLEPFPIVVECEGYGSTTVTVDRGGLPGSGPGWLTVSGQLTLVQSVTISAGGQVVFAKTYGQKTGLGPTFTCSGTFPDGAVFSAEVVAVT